MNYDIIIQVSWGSRQETLSDCATKLKKTFDILSASDPMFDQWYHKRNSPIPDRSVEWHSEAYLEQLLKKGMRFTDEPRSPMVELGYSLNLWNGDYIRRGAEIGIYCGGVGNRTNNRIVLKLLASDEFRPDSDLILRVFEGLVRSWHPEIGKVFQLISRNEDLDECCCAGFIRPPTVPVDKKLRFWVVDDGIMWFDEAAYVNYT